MTLSDAIKHCEEVAKGQDYLAKRCDDASGYTRSHNEAIRTEEAKKHCECASEHRQLAEWLRELKGYRIAHYKLRDMDYEYDFNSMFGENPMYYGEKVWDLFGDIDAGVEYEVMGYEEVNNADSD